MKAVILAGGYGKRLRPYTETTPKPLLPVAGKGIIEWQIRWLKHYGIDEIVICAGYLKEKIIEQIGNGSRYGVKVGYVCLLYTSPSPRDLSTSRMPSSA